MSHSKFKASAIFFYQICVKVYAIKNLRHICLTEDIQLAEFFDQFVHL